MEAMPPDEKRKFFEIKTESQPQQPSSIINSLLQPLKNKTRIAEFREKLHRPKSTPAATTCDEYCQKL